VRYSIELSTGDRQTDRQQAEAGIEQRRQQAGAGWAYSARCASALGVALSAVLRVPVGLYGVGNYPPPHTVADRVSERAVLHRNIARYTPIPYPTKL
jgi:hypothetical protein